MSSIVAPALISQAGIGLSSARFQDQAYCRGTIARRVTS
jgi:hypothetical protein